VSTGRRVGVIGCGNIGGAIATHLVQDGHHVSVHDAGADRLRPLVGLGARAADTPAKVAERSEITFMSLPTPAVVDQVAARWLEGAHPGSVLVDLSTNAPATVRALGDRLAAAGCHLLEAPLTGGAPGAQARMLVFMVGGDAAVYDQVEPVLKPLGRAVFHVGGLGLGNTAKLVNSLVAFTATCASLEVLAVAVKAGIDLRTMVEVIRTGGAGNFFTDRMVEGINERGRPPMFALSLAAKDAGLLCDVAREQGVPVPVSAQVAQALVAALGAGLGDHDFTDLVELVERQANVKLRLGPPRA
jgi:3-hydroxyisobutyrate dehydrogenase-like beta-hydroxyacid dehydrogenase